MISPDNLVIQGFWTGPLTTMERLSMKSFVANGHQFELYVYDEPEGIPAGVVLKDAREIVPESEIATFRCAQQLSDFFRISLLLKKGGWFSDLDNVCLRALDFAAPFVFYRDYDETTISFALSKTPADSAIMQHCYDFLVQMDPDERSRLAWQEIGSDFTCGAVEYFKMTRFAEAGRTFDPIQWTRIREVIDPAVKWDLGESYSVHLFHAVWNKGPKDRMGKGFNLGQPVYESLDTDGEYPDGCLYEILKRRYDAQA